MRDGLEHEQELANKAIPNFKHVRECELTRRTRM